MFANVSAKVELTEMAGFPCAGTWICPQAVIDNVFKVLYVWRLESGKVIKFEQFTDTLLVAKSMS